jgi:hypothetical protein
VLLTISDVNWVYLLIGITGRARTILWLLLLL